MSYAFRAPRAMLDRKPPHGAPCNRCGLCCVATLCDLGRHFFGRAAGPCPALRFDQEGNSACGLTLCGEQKYSDAAALLIGAGDGCDARFNGEWTNTEFHKHQARLDVERADEIAKAKALWSMEG